MENNKNKKQNDPKVVKKTNKKPQVKKQANDELSPRVVLVFRVFIIVALVATIAAIGLIVYELITSKEAEETIQYEDYYVMHRIGTSVEDLGIMLNPKAEEGYELDDISDEWLRTIAKGFFNNDKTVYILTYHSSDLNSSDSTIKDNATKIDEALVNATYLKKGVNALEDVQKDYVFLLIDLDSALFTANAIDIRTLNEAFENVINKERFRNILYAYSYVDGNVFAEVDNQTTGFSNGAVVAVDKIVDLIKGLE